MFGSMLRYFDRFLLDALLLGESLNGCATDDATMLQLLQEGTEVVSCYRILLVGFDLTHGVHLQVIVEDCRGRHQNSALRWIEVAGGNHFLGHVRTVLDYLNSCQLLGIPEPDLSTLRDRNELMLFVVKLKHYNFVFVGFDLTILELGCLIKYVDFARNSSISNNVESFRVANTTDRASTLSFFLFAA
jgi:hypothetical protein